MKMRLFIAVNFGNDTISSLAGLRDMLRSNSEHGKFPLSENMHLTIVFIGECDERRAEDVKRIMDSVPFKKFDIIADRIGRFRRKGGDIWWAGIRDNIQLNGLHRELCKKLKDSGFDIDTRDHEPHITIGREIRTNERPGDIEPFGETVNRVELMRSDRIDGKLVYSCIHAKEADR
jgi:2'-5' RNA ligase